MKVEVTQECINEGIKGDCEACPIALAVRKVTGKLVNILPLYADVFEDYDQYEEGDYVRYKLPLEATRFVRAFDGRRSVVPFEFELEQGVNKVSFIEVD